MALRFSLNTFPKLVRQQTMSQSTMVIPKAHIPAMYSNRSEYAGVVKSLFNPQDPRTFPRYAVALMAACFFSVSTANSFWYNRHHLESEVKNDMQAPTHTERPVFMARTLSNGPIAMHSKRYETLRHYGLGVEKNEWKEQK